MVRGAYVAVSAFPAPTRPALLSRVLRDGQNDPANLLFQEFESPGEEHQDGKLLLLILPDLNPKMPTP